MPHIPLYASNEFKGKSLRGLYGDVVSELDWGVGQLLKQLKKYKLEENTLVVFTSDNGPWKVYKTHGGSAGPLRGGKGTTWEGGVREPAIFWWPGHIQPGQQITDVASTMDILPTIANLCNASLPEKEIDGRDISGLLLGKAALEEAPFVYYSKMGQLAGVRMGAYKLIFDGKEFRLYNIEEDISEEYDLRKKEPDQFERLQKLMMEQDERITKGMREVGQISIQK